MSCAAGEHLEEEAARQESCLCPCHPVALHALLLPDTSPPFVAYNSDSRLVRPARGFSVWRELSDDILCVTLVGEGQRGAGGLQGGSLT